MSGCFLLFRLKDLLIMRNGISVERRRERVGGARREVTMDKQERLLFEAANKYADSDNPFLGQQRTFQAFLAGAAFVEKKYRMLMACNDWDGAAWTFRPEQKGRKPISDSPLQS